jgi:hypothetical protein
MLLGLWFVLTQESRVLLGMWFVLTQAMSAANGVRYAELIPGSVILGSSHECGLGRGSGQDAAMTGGLCCRVQGRPGCWRGV